MLDRNGVRELIPFDLEGYSDVALQIPRTGESCCYHAQSNSIVTNHEAPSFYESSPPGRGPLSRRTTTPNGVIYRLIELYSAVIHFLSCRDD